MITSKHKIFLKYSVLSPLRINFSKNNLSSHFLLQHALIKHFLHGSLITNTVKIKQIKFHNITLRPTNSYKVLIYTASTIGQLYFGKDCTYLVNEISDFINIEINFLVIFTVLYNGHQFPFLHHNKLDDLFQVFRKY